MQMTVSEFVHDLQKRAIYIFREDEISTNVTASNESIRKALTRLIEKKKIVRLHTGLFCIVPVEYENAGAPPTVWFIDALMNYLNQPYYVGLLTAGALQGAAHQQPSEFQVITTKQQRPLNIGRTCIKFYNRKDFQNIPIHKMKSEAGYFNVSSPEIIAFDLVKYVKHVGAFHNVATVLQELSTKINPEKLVEAASFFDIPTIQRTGYILEAFGEVNVTQNLLLWINEKKPRHTSLRPDKPCQGEKNTHWRIIINEIIEVDE
jgi:predicted transcriptional regulator of viral defense system